MSDEPKPERKRRGFWTEQRRRFVEIYTGNAKAAAIQAGYSVKAASRLACELMKNPRIVSAIRARADRHLKPFSAGREELQEFWSDIIRNKDALLEDRIKASALLGKSHGMFVDKVQLNSTNTTTVPKVDEETARAWARKTLPAPVQEEEEAEVVGPH